MMLLPSAMGCDGGSSTKTKSTRPLLRRFMACSGGASGMVPTLSTIQEATSLAPVIDTATASSCSSPMLSPSSISSGIQSTCRALQSLLGVTPPPGSSMRPKRNRIPLPPSHNTSPLRALPVQEHRVSKPRTSPPRPTLPLRGRNKRTREDFEAASVENDMDIDPVGPADYLTRGHRYSYDSGYVGSSSSEGDTESACLSGDMKPFSTPKRRRRLPGPDHIPFGLERRDFADLDDTNAAFSTPCSFMNDSSPQEPATVIGPSTSALSQRENNAQDTGNEDFWTSNDDAQLITVVLEKLKLSRRDWEDCAKVLGAEGEGGSLGKRWKWLMEEGKVGLRMNSESGTRFEGRRTRRRSTRGDVRMAFA